MRGSEGPTTRAEPIYFGGRGRPLAGWLHLPDSGMARAGVVLCPTLGLEGHAAYPAYRRVAVALAEAGLAALRFDYYGTGDSGGLLAGDGSVASWLEDVAEACSHLRACGVQRTALVGLRIGATIAAAAARQAELDALVLWDPCTKGRTFIRQQEALKALSLGETPQVGEEGLELSAMLVPQALLAELRQLRIEQADGPLARRCLVLERAERPRDAGLEEALAGCDVEWRSVEGQEEFIDASPGVSVAPEATMEALTGWLAASFADAPRLPVTVTGDTELLLPGGKGGPAVRERGVRFGAHGAFGILSEPVGDAVGPAVVLSNVGPLHHIGPARLWVDLARAWAREGRRVLRFDLGGLGDSPVHPGRTPEVTYPFDGVEDLAEAAAAASPGDPRAVVLAGICSGAYHSVEAASRLRPAGIAIVNPVVNLVPPQLREPGAPIDPEDGLRPPHRLLDWMRQNQHVVQLAKWPPLDALRHDPRLGDLLDDWVPERLWRLVMRAGLAHAPSGRLAGLVDEGTDVLVVCGRREARPYRRCRQMVDQLSRSGAFRLEVLEEIDHSLFGAAAREAVEELLRAHLQAAFPLPAPGGEPAAPAPVARRAGVALAPATDRSIGRFLATSVAIAKLATRRHR